MATTISGLDFIGEVTSADRDILTPEACAFLAGLVDQFAPRRDALLEARAVWQAKIDAGALPEFRADSKSVRDGDWRVGALPADLLDRRVEITGPVTRKMIINALNADVKVFMADFEDALSPTWRNVIEGQANMRDAVSRTISFEDPNSGKQYKLGDNPAVLIARVRGLHLDEKNVHKDGKPIPGCLMDFALYLFHNHQRLRENSTGPYFYVPKLEHYEEARWWNEVFVAAQEELGIARGTIKATCLILFPA
jgi:malate synthase